MNKIERQFLYATHLHARVEEVWLVIKEFPKYEASSRGGIRNAKTQKLVVSGTSNGYQYIEMNDKAMHHVHRIICTTFWPNPLHKRCVDHIDNNRSNNNITNLRWATYSENMMNRSKQINNKSGVTGVHWDKREKKWRAQIKIDGIKKYLGSFRSLQAAKVARIKAVDRLFGEFANTKTNC